MEEKSKGSSTSQLLNYEGGKTKSNAIEIPSISLPKGGGAIKGIDEKFSVNAVNGTASFSIPLPFATARGAAPALSLSYNSGSGNGIFGLGWNLSLASVKRKTDKGLPQYFDHIDSDTFLFSEAEDLVPEFEKNDDRTFIRETNGAYKIFEKDSQDGLFKIRFYKPRTEGLFARIERWTDTTTGIIKWRVITKDNITTLFGWSEKSRITDPSEHSKTYEWLPEFVFDDKGNCSKYIYKEEDAEGLDSEALHNKNRINKGRLSYTNLYVEKILYGNKNPYQKFGDPFPIDTDFVFETCFDYGHLNAADAPEKINPWNFRIDAFSEYKAGFEIRTARLCKRILLFHRFDAVKEYNGLVRSMNFEYDTSSQKDFTFLKAITAQGYIKKADGTYAQKNLPATEFVYQPHEWNGEVKNISPENLVHAPAGLDELQYQFTDLFNEGLSGILTEQAGGWYYKHNVGHGHFENAKLISPKPSFSGLGGQLQLTDLEANGSRQLVNYATEPKGYFALCDDNEWQPFKNFPNLPNINLNDANARMLDLNGDGKADVFISEDHVFTWYASAGKNGFTTMHRTAKPYDEEAGPNIVFSDSTQSIFLADMSGDGLSDIVRIRNGEICYWPNLGYGKFGAKVWMDHAPVFDLPASFNPAFIRLADIDGSGTTDIIYFGKNKFSCWNNLSGNSFSTVPFEMEAFPEVHNQAKITVTDLLGNGVACIVWSSPLSVDAHAPLKYVDLMNSRKPHIMVGYKNNMGKEVSMEYKPSTHFYIEDKLSGKPWVTKLHFPVHCLTKTETKDKISGWRFVSEYKYHHGYYDHAEREFRGFGRVEQTDTEDFELWQKSIATNTVEDKILHQPPMLSKTWIHTGAFLGSEKILDQFAHEYWYEVEVMKQQGFAANNSEHHLPAAKIIDEKGNDLIAPGELSAQDWQEALRACKGMALRSEVFARDADHENMDTEGLWKELIPYTVATHNCIIQRLQPKGHNQHAIFMVNESEAITYSYERSISPSLGGGGGEADPRIAHNLNISFDEYGNVLEAASVVYPRKIENVALPQVTKSAQAETLITYTENTFTNDIDVRLEPNEPDAYRLRLPAEVKTYQLRGVTIAGRYYVIENFKDILGDTKSSTAVYHELDKPLIAGKSQKRLIEHIRTIYRSNNLVDDLPAGMIQSLGIPYESYQLVYTKELLHKIYNEKVADNSLILLMQEGKFTATDNGTRWWIPSGKINFRDSTDPDSLEKAKARFYLPISYTDPYGAMTSVAYGNYHLFIQETTDALLNTTIVTTFNYRTLSPRQMNDANDNLSEVLTDELGLVKAMAVMGKDLNNDGIGDEGDILTGLEETTAHEQNDIHAFFQIANTTGVCPSDDLQAKAKQLLKNATSRFIYDFEAYKNTGKPAVVTAITREQHFKNNPQSPIQLSFEYSNGLGKVIMKKVQAAPGKAQQVTVNANGSITIAETDTATLLRWLGNGRTILNNKGNAVKQYEPFFSVSPKFEDEKELVETGVTPIMYYDALSRLVKTEMPDGTFSKVAFDAWQQSLYDANDTVKDSRWYTERKALPINNQERKAAEKAEAHDNTPSELHLDTLGRPVLQIENNGKNMGGLDILYNTKIELDIEGNLRRVTDARENGVMEYQYDMLGTKVYQKSMDAGQRWLLINSVGNPLRTWDERNHEFQYFYDILHRPKYRMVKGGDIPGVTLDHVCDRIEYGENEPNNKQKNLRGKPIRQYDTGGLVATPEYDFKGQPKSTTRKLYKKYKEVANWTDANLQRDLENETFTFITETDALGRITKQTVPDGSMVTPFYNETGLLHGETVLLPGSTSATMYIKNINYNEKGQREKIIYGNNVGTTFYYDTKTFRLKRLETKRQNNDPLQDLYYTHDPVGNITHIEDKNIPLVFFDNQKVAGVAEYTYDALYRLVEATGRENNAAFGFDSKDNWNDAPFIRQMNPGDPMAIRNYMQRYQYDEAGNIRQMQHLATGNNWTRNYEYETINNRLKNTKVGRGPGTFTYLYPHHPQHGFIMAMPHLEEMGWNFKEELVKTIRQKVNPGNGTAETTWYQYDGQGQRIRKITENTSNTGATLTKKDERIYIAGYETYRTYSANTINFERTSLSLLDEGHRFVMVETVKTNTAATPASSERVGERIVHYQLHNHLGSAALELNETAQVISYEEYHPYGTTAFQAKNATIKAAAKRFRYTGMERDEETGLEYHSARYYLPWLGRWLSTDPIGIGDGVNVYCYVSSNPIRHIDKRGRQATNPKDQIAPEEDLSNPNNWSGDPKFVNVKGIQFRIKVTDKQYVEIYNKLEEMATQVITSDKILGSYKKKSVTDVFIVFGQSSRFTKWDKKPVIVIDPEKDINKSAIAHEMGHKLFNDLQNSMKDKKAQDFLLSVIDIYSRLKQTKAEKILDEKKPIPIGLLMFDPTQWGNDATSEHPWQDADEMFASALEAFQMDPKGLKASIDKAIELDLTVKEPANQMLNLLKELNENHKLTSIELPKERRQAAQETLSSIGKPNPLFIGEAPAALKGLLDK